MKYNFDELTQRRGSNSLKWDVAENELPMWIADMDFKTAPEITRALQNKIKSGIYGYQIVPDEWYSAIIGWWKSRHNFEIEKDWLCFCTGVVPAVTSSVKRLTSAGDNVLLLTPVYDIFFHSVENTGRKVLESPLLYKDGKYSINFKDLEEKLANPLTTMMILCNPHNPAGKIWTASELKAIGGLCKKYNVSVLSDEIHCEITELGTEYVPFASVSKECAEISVTCLSASKAFNLGGVQSAAVFVPNAALREKIVCGLNSDEVAEPNVIAIESTVAAFTKGEKWLNELNQYISANRKTAAAFIKTNVPKLHLIEQSATYLLWVDCGEITEDTEELCKFIREYSGLYITAGGQYRGNGKRFVRINIACPRERLLDGLNRLKKSVDAYICRK